MIGMKAIGRLADIFFWNGVEKRNSYSRKHMTNQENSVEKGNSSDNSDYKNPEVGEVKKPGALKNILARKLKILREAIEETDREIDERKKLTGYFRDQIDSEIKECQVLLDKLPYPWSEGFLPKMEFIRISLHKSLLTRRKDKRSEELSFWEDLTGLLKERRKLIMEYEEIKDAQDKLS